MANIKEYIIQKVIEYNNEKDKEIEKLKTILRDNNVCFECICSKCNKEIYDIIHSHNTLIENCFYNCFYDSI